MSEYDRTAGYGPQGPAGQGGGGAAPRRLTRSSTQKVIGGVAGGLAQYFGLDPVIFRIAFVVLALAGASGIILYLLAWALLPRDDSDRSYVQELADGPRRGAMIVAGVLLALGVAALLGEAEFFESRLLRLLFFGALGLGVLWLWEREDDNRRGATPDAPGAVPPPTSGPAAPTGPGAFGPSAYAADPRIDSLIDLPVDPVTPVSAPSDLRAERDDASLNAPPGHPVGRGQASGGEAGKDPTEPTPPSGSPSDLASGQAGDAPTDPGATVPAGAVGAAAGAEVGSPPPPPPGSPPTAPMPLPSGPPMPPAPPPPRGRSITAIVVSLLLVAAGIAGLVGVTATAFFALSLMVVGACLLVGSRWGRVRGLIPVGLVLVVGLVISSFFDFLDVPLRGGVGERLEKPVGAFGLVPEYRLGVGQLTVDLTDVDLAGRTVRASVGMGDLRVEVPDNVDVVVEGRVGMGRMNIFGREFQGVGVSSGLIRDTGPFERRFPNRDSDRDSDRDSRRDFGRDVGRDPGRFPEQPGALRGNELRLQVEVGMGEIEVTRD